MAKAKAIIKQDIENAVAIYKWIEQNKHKYKNGVTQSTSFSGVVKYYDELNREGYYPADLHYPDPLSIKYTSHIARLKRNGYLRLQSETVNGPRTWSVNTNKLPVGAIDYTGVRTTIPEPPKVLPPVNPTESLQKFHDEGRAFIEEELKQITLEQAIVRRKGVVLNLIEPTLYQLYKLGMTLNEVTEPIDDEPANDKQEEQTLPDIPEAESEQEGGETVETFAPF